MEPAPTEPTGTAEVNQLPLEERSLQSGKPNCVRSDASESGNATGEAPSRSHKNRRRGRGKKQAAHDEAVEGETHSVPDLIKGTAQGDTSEKSIAKELSQRAGSAQEGERLREERRRRRKRQHHHAVGRGIVDDGHTASISGSSEAFSHLGSRAGQWSLGLVLPLHSFPSLDSPTFSRQDTFHNGTSESLIWDSTLMRIVEDAALDPMSIESLVQNLATALPEISQEAKRSRNNSFAVTAGEFDHSQASELELIDEEGPMVFSRDHLHYVDEESFFSVPARGYSGDGRPHNAAKIWGSASSLASLSRAVASYAVDEALLEPSEQPPIWHEWDPDRVSRVSLVVEMAEEERGRRISEKEASRWRDRVDRAAQIEWAVMAMKQRASGLGNDHPRNDVGLTSSSTTSGSPDDARQKLNDLKVRSVAPLVQDASPLTDYEVICPYSVLGCDVTLPRSELPKHLEECSCKAEVLEARRLARIREEYNPLDHIVVCPYSVLGCEFSCRRADLPAHLLTCPFKTERQNSAMMVYEVVCPNATLGCTVTCLRSQIALHLVECSFRSKSRQEEDAERASNKVIAIQAEEQERSRRLSSLRDDAESWSSAQMENTTFETGVESKSDPQRRRSALEHLHGQIYDIDRTSSNLRHVEQPHLTALPHAVEATWQRENPLPSVLNAQERLKSGGKSEGVRLADSRGIRHTASKPVAAPAHAQEHHRRAKERTASLDGRAISRLRGDYIPLDRSTTVPLPVPPPIVGIPEVMDVREPIRLARSASLSLPGERPYGDVGLDDEFLRTRRVSWIVQAAEIERMRMIEEEKIAKSIKSPSLVPPTSGGVSVNGGSMLESSPQVSIAKSPPISPQRRKAAPGHVEPLGPASPLRARKGGTQHVKADDDASESPPGRRRIVLEQVLRRQKLHHAEWFPAGELAFEGRRTHVHMFHSHMEHQTRLLHKVLSDEIEEFGRDCALWEMESQTYVSGLVEKIRGKVVSAWIKFVSRNAPSVHLFGSFASELSVPGISDLDLVVVPGEDLPAAVVRNDPGAGADDVQTVSLLLPSPSSDSSSGPRSTNKPSRSPSVDSSIAHGQGSQGSSSLLGKLRQRATPPKDASSDVYIRTLMRDRLEAARRCRILGEALRECEFLKNVKVIDTALVPVISMETTDAPGSLKLDIDLTIALSNHDGLAAAEFVRVLRLRFPPLMPMVRLLKAFLHSRDLANPFHGGLPSYALVLMATCSIIRSCERVGPRQAPSLSQGELILDFLDLFGREFDYRSDAVCCNWRADFDRLRMSGMYSTSEPPLLRIAARSEGLSANAEVSLVVDDPIRFGNNVGRSCFAFHLVQQAFAEVLATLLQHVVKNEALSRSRSGFGATSSILERVFGVTPLKANQSTDSKRNE